MIVARAHPAGAHRRGLARTRARGRRARGARGRQPLDRGAVRARGGHGPPGGSARCCVLRPRRRRGDGGARSGGGPARDGGRASRATRSRSGAAASPRIPPSCRARRARRCSRPTSRRARADGAALAFEQTGAYRLLLSAMSENPTELQRFYAETVEPLVAYDEQYETDLVRTLETFLEADGNVAGHRAAAVHAPPHDLLPPGARARAVRPRRQLERRAREAQPRAEVDARARDRLRRRSRLGGGRRRRPRAAPLGPALVARSLRSGGRANSIA